MLVEINMVPNPDSKPGMSRNDKYAMDLLNNSKKQVNGHYQDKGFAERLSEHDLEDDNCWYLPHHAVSYPRMSNKVTVVFDCAARYNGTSLNEQLLTGPDLLNNLFGVLNLFVLEREK